MSNSRFLRRLSSAGKVVVAIVIALDFFGSLYVIARGSAHAIQTTAKNGLPFLAGSLVVMILIGAFVVIVDRKDTTKQEGSQE